VKDKRDEGFGEGKIVFSHRPRHITAHSRCIDGSGTVGTKKKCSDSSKITIFCGIYVVTFSVTIKELPLSTSKVR